MSSEPRSMSSHSCARELLPWYANRTLDSEERRQVEEHVEACPLCARELAALEHLAAAARQEGEPQRNAASSFARLVSRLDAAGEPSAERSWWRGARRLLVATPPPVRAALAAQALLLAVAVAWIVLAPAPLPEPHFRTLAESEVVEAPPGEWHVRVVFAAGATAEQIEAILRGGGLRIVEGPGPGGVYTLRPGAGAEPLPTVLERLRGDPVVGLAEPAATDGPREEP